MPHHRRPSVVPHAGVSRRAMLGGLATGGLATLLAACTASSTASRTTGSASPHSSTPTSTSGSPSASASASPSATETDARTVTVASQFADGTVVGVGMPIVLTFTPSPTDAAAFVKAATVTVNGSAVQGAWYWSQPYAGEPMQAHFRTQSYWPANATVEAKLPIGGLSAGKGLVYGDGLTSLTFRTGDKHVTYVDGAAETAKVMVNDTLVRTMPASLGKAHTRTYTGTKVVMQKGEDVPGTHTLRPDGAVRMENTEHTYDLMVDWSVRVTESGEYLHAAPWNSEIGKVSTSDGCTNLSTANAKWFYHFARVGDVVIYSNTGGKAIPLWDGLTDWNIDWATYQQGGLLSPT